MSWDCPLIETATDIIELLPMLEVILINATGHWERKVQLNLCLTIPATSAFQQTVLTQELELELIDFGAEEVLKMKTDIDLWCFASFGTIQKRT
jgi:hypothetical protein